MAERPIRDATGRAAAVYWRRRAAALTVSLTVLIGLSWGGTWAVGSLVRAGRAGVGPGQSAGASTSGAAGATTLLNGSTQLGVPDATSARRAAAAALPACPVADVGLHLSASQPSYPVQQLPEFDIDVVSSASYSCSFDLGARHVLLQISAGTAHIWTSADCAEGLAVQLATLRRGVPDVVPMTWDDRYSAAGCPVPGRAAAAGTYTATATAGSTASNSVTFQIS